MTYEEVRILFSKYPVASTWNSANPRALHFDTGPKSNYHSRDLHAPNRGERYVKVPFAEVASHVEENWKINSEDISTATSSDVRRCDALAATHFPGMTGVGAEKYFPGR